MTDRIVLTPQEIKDLTGRTERAQKRYGSQADELAALGIPFNARTDKTLIVFRDHVYAAARPTTPSPVEPPAVCL